jgi:hypothetical protein
MSDHKAIIVRSGGSTVLGQRIGVVENTVKAWKRNNSIPGSYWKAIVDAGLASYGELAEAIDFRYLDS